MCNMIWTSLLLEFKNRWVGQMRRTKQYFAPLNTFKLSKLAQHFNSEWIHFRKTSSNSPDSLGQTSCTLKVQQLNEQISECSSFFLLPSMYQMGLHLHAWGLKGKTYWRKIQPRSLFADMGQLYFRHQWDFLISGHVQGQVCWGRKMAGLQMFLVSTVCCPMLYSTHSWGRECG